MSRAFHARLTEMLNVDVRKHKMKDIGKIIGTYFYALGLVSFVSMLHILIIQKQSFVEMTWIFLWMFGLFMWKHSNLARRIVVGFNSLVLVFALAVLIGTGGIPSHSSSLTIFSVNIQSPTSIQLWAFTSFFTLSSLAVIILLMTPKAKKEFSNQRLHSIAGSARSE